MHQARELEDMEPRLWIVLSQKVGRYQTRRMEAVRSRDQRAAGQRGRGLEAKERGGKQDRGIKDRSRSVKGNINQQV